MKQQITPLLTTTNLRLQPGFCVFVGDAALRNPKGGYDPKVYDRCIPKGDNNFNCAQSESITLRTKFCEGDIRSAIIFPYC